MRLAGLVLFACFATKSSAQELFVFSDVPLLQEPSGKGLGCDAISSWAQHAPLSPAVRQGESLNLLVAVTNQRGSAFVLQTGQNPAESFRVQTGRLFPPTDWVDEPVAVPNPVRGRIGEHQTCALFLLVVTAPPDAPIGRVKLEPAVWIPDSAGGNYWIRYPMEVRVVPAGESKPPCLIQETSLRKPLMQSVWEILGECPNPKELPQYVEKVRRARQLLGRNQ
jgi:hypothetical protein